MKELSERPWKKASLSGHSSEQNDGNYITCRITRDQILSRDHLASIRSRSLKLWSRPVPQSLGNGLRSLVAVKVLSLNRGSFRLGYEPGTTKSESAYYVIGSQYHITFHS
jgi:hypothetical protein